MATEIFKIKRKKSLFGKQVQLSSSKTQIFSNYGKKRKEGKLK